MKKSIGAKAIIHPTPVAVVGTYDSEGEPNVMTAAWVGICCSRPPCVSLSLRKATYTYASLAQRQAFTLNIPSEDYIKETDYFGMVSGRNEKKFSTVGLTPVASDLVDAPYVKEFPFVLECRLVHSVELGLHTQFVGEILDIKAEEECLGEGGVPDIEKVRPILYVPETRIYFGIGRFLGKAYSLGRQFLKG